MCRSVEDCALDSTRSMDPTAATKKPPTRPSSGNPDRPCQTADRIRQERFIRRPRYGRGTGGAEPRAESATGHGSGGGTGRRGAERRIDAREPQRRGSGSDLNDVLAVYRKDGHNEPVEIPRTHQHADTLSFRETKARGFRRHPREGIKEPSFGGAEPSAPTVRARSRHPRRNGPHAPIREMDKFIRSTTFLSPPEPPSWARQTGRKPAIALKAVFVDNSLRLMVRAGSTGATVLAWHASRSGTDGPKNPTLTL